jgi:hypothetical protein
VIFCCGDFDLFLRFFGKIPFFQPSILVVKDYKHALLGMFLQLMFFQQLLDLIAISKWFLRSSKPCVAMMFTSAPLLCSLLDDEQSKQGYDKKAIRCNFIFFFL